MSFLYPRSITVQRATQAFSATEGSYQTLTTVLSAVPCMIDIKRPKGNAVPVGFPGASNTDAPMPYWYITCQGSDVPTPTTIQEADLVLDDAGRSYKVEAVWWTPIGTVLACEPYRPHS
jgi:hypothetical protein